MDEAQTNDTESDESPGTVDPDRYRPGSFGCHELLDRTAFVAAIVEQDVLDHPACAQNPAWHALAERAVDALQELYQQVGAAHLGDE